MVDQAAILSELELFTESCWVLGRLSNASSDAERLERSVSMVAINLAEALCAGISTQARQDAPEAAACYLPAPEGWWERNVLIINMRRTQLMPVAAAASPGS